MSSESIDTSGPNLIGEEDFSDENIRRAAALELAQKFGSSLDPENVQAIEDFLSTIDTQFSKEDTEESNAESLKNGVKDFLRLDPHQREYRYGLAVKNVEQGAASVEDEIIIAIAEHNDSQRSNSDDEPTSKRILSRKELVSLSKEEKETIVNERVGEILDKIGGVTDNNRSDLEFILKRLLTKLTQTDTFDGQDVNDLNEFQHVLYGDNGPSLEQIKTLDEQLKQMGVLVNRDHLDAVEGTAEDGSIIPAIRLVVEKPVSIETKGRESLLSDPNLDTPKDQAESDPATQERIKDIKSRINEIEKMMEDKNAYPVDSPQRNEIALERQKKIIELKGLEPQVDSKTDIPKDQTDIDPATQERIKDIKELLDKLKKEHSTIELWDEDKFKNFNPAIALITRLLYELENQIEPTVTPEEVNNAKVLVGMAEDNTSEDDEKLKSDQEIKDIADKNARRKRWWEINDRLIGLTEELQEQLDIDKSSQKVKDLRAERIRLEAEQTKLAEGFKDINDSRDEIVVPRTRMAGTAKVTIDDKKDPSKELVPTGGGPSKELVPTGGGPSTELVPTDGGPSKELVPIEPEVEPTPEALEQWVFAVGAQTDTLERVAAGAMTEVHHEQKELGKKKWFNPVRWIKGLKFNPMVKKITTEGRAFKMIKRIRGATEPDGAVAGVDFAATALGITVDQAEAEEQAVVGAVLDAALRRPGDTVREFDGSEEEPSAVTELRQKIKDLVYEHIANTQDYNTLSQDERAVADGVLKDKFNDYYAKLIKQNPELFTEHSLLVLSSNILKIASQTRAVLAAENGREQAEQRLNQLKINIGDVRAGQESLSEIDTARLEKALGRMKNGKVASVLGKQIGVGSAFAGALLVTGGLSYAAGEIASRGALAGTKWGTTTLGTVVLGPVGAVVGFGVGVAATGMLSRHFVGKGHKESLDDLAHVKGTEARADDAESYNNASAEQTAEAMLSVMDIPVDSDGNEQYDQATLKPNITLQEIEQAMRLLAGHNARRALEAQAAQNGKVINLYYSETLVGLQKLNFAETKLKELLEGAYLTAGIPTGQTDQNGLPVNINYVNAMQTISTERLTTFKHQQDVVDEVRVVVDKKVKRLGLVLGGAGSAFGALGSALAIEALSSGAAPTILDTFGDLGKEAFTLGDANTMFDNLGSSAQPSGGNAAAGNVTPVGGNANQFSPNYDTFSTSSGEFGLKLPDDFNVNYSPPDASGTYIVAIEAPNGTSPFGGTDVAYITVDKSGAIDPVSASNLDSWGFTASEISGSPTPFANQYDALMAHPAEVSNGNVAQTAWLDNGSPDYAIENAAALMMDSKSGGTGAVFSIDSQGQSWNASGLVYDPVELANKGELFFAIRAQAADGSMIMVKEPAMVGPDGVITGATSGWKDALFQNNPNGGPPIGAPVNLATVDPSGGIISFAEVTGTDAPVEISGAKVIQLTPDNIPADPAPVPPDSAPSSATPGYAIPPSYVPTIYSTRDKNANSSPDGGPNDTPEGGNGVPVGPVGPTPPAPRPNGPIGPDGKGPNVAPVPAPAPGPKAPEQQGTNEIDLNGKTEEITEESQLNKDHLYVQIIYTANGPGSRRLLRYDRKDQNGNHIFVATESTGNTYEVNAGTWESLNAYDGWIRTGRLLRLANGPKDPDKSSDDNGKTKPKPPLAPPAVTPAQGPGGPDKGQFADTSTTAPQSTVTPGPGPNSQGGPKSPDQSGQTQPIRIDTNGQGGEDQIDTLTDLPVVKLPGGESLNTQDVTVKLPKVNPGQILIDPDGRRCIVIGLEQDRLRVMGLEQVDIDSTQPIYYLPINDKSTGKTKEVGAKNRQVPEDAPLIDGNKLVINQIYSYRIPGTQERRDRVFMGYLKGKDGKQGKYIFKEAGASDSDPNAYVMFNDSTFSISKKSFSRVGEKVKSVEDFKPGYFLVPPGEELYMGRDTNMIIKIKSIKENDATIEYLDPYGEVGTTVQVTLEELMGSVNERNLRLVSESSMRWVPTDRKFGVAIDGSDYSLAA